MDGFLARKILNEVITLAVIPPIINTIKCMSTLTGGMTDHYEYYKNINLELNE
jgi:hypothetical protein